MREYLISQVRVNVCALYFVWMSVHAFSRSPSSNNVCDEQT